VVTDNVPNDNGGTTTITSSYAPVLFPRKVTKNGNVLLVYNYSNKSTLVGYTFVNGAFNAINPTSNWTLNPDNASYFQSGDISLQGNLTFAQVAGISDMNDAGVVVGYEPAVSSNGGYYWTSSGLLQTIDPYPLSPHGELPTFINDDGGIIGFTLGANGVGGTGWLYWRNTSDGNPTINVVSYASPVAKQGTITTSEPLFPLAVSPSGKNIISYTTDYLGDTSQGDYFLNAEQLHYEYNETVANGPFMYSGRAVPNGINDSGRYLPGAGSYNWPRYNGGAWGTYASFDIPMPTFADSDGVPQVISPLLTSGQTLAINNNFDILVQENLGNYAIFTWTAPGPPTPTNPSGLGSYSKNLLSFSTLSGWTVTSLGNGNSMNDSRMLIGTISNGTITAPAAFVPCALLVDANRDGLIDGNDVGATSATAPFRFWINDNQDVGSSTIPGQSGHTVPATTPDYLSDVVVSPRDLEDWNRLWVYIGGLSPAIKAGTIKVGFKWQSTNGTTPGIKLITASDPAGGLGYLSDTTGASAAAQAAPDPNDPFDSTVGVTALGRRLVLKDANDKHTNIVPTSGAADFVLPTWIWANLGATNPLCFLLFEGTSEGQGQLQIVFLNQGGTTQIGIGGSVSLGLMQIKEMYQRAIAAGAGPVPNPPQEPYVTNSGAFNDGSIATTMDVTVPFVAPPNENKQCLIYTHGFYTNYNDFCDYSEIMYKRLWWQGYKGRVIGYMWPALLGFDSFNSSEWIAWLYGRAFMNFVNGLHTSFDLVTVAAHSQGNVMVSSAIQEGLKFDNYILLEAALPTGLYNSNNNYNQYPVFSDSAQTAPLTPDLASNLGYRGLIAPAMGNVANYYCYYNPGDFYLVSGTMGPLSTSTNWVANELSYKPDDLAGPNLLAAGAGYGTYLMLNGMPTFSQFSQGAIGGNTTVTNRTVTEVHESVSFVALPRSAAAGFDSNSVLVFGHGANLSKSPFNFGVTSDDHGGQFNRDYSFVYTLYQQLEQIASPPTNQ
jgi:hypothetical protein